MSLVALSLVACSDGTEPDRLSCDTGPGITPPYTTVSQGSLVATTTGSTTETIFGRATGYQHGTVNAAYTVLDGYSVDAQGHPTGELFLLLRSPSAAGETPLVPVSLDDLNNPQFVPSGAIAAYADGENASGEFQRWLVAKSGCIRITESVQPTATAPGSVTAIAALQGEWRSSAGALIGPGAMSVRVKGPLLDFRAGSSQALDSMRAVITGVRPGAFAESGLEAFQVLHPGQTRLVIVGTQAADTTREIWLSLAGVPDEADSIPLSTVTLAEARATRPASAKSFAMVRMIEYPSPTQPTVRELWTSMSGYVKIESVTQAGPLALCGSVKGSFAFSAQGTSLATPGSSLGTIDVTAGKFKTRMTIVARTDTLVDPATVPAATPGTVHMAAPTSTMGFGCQ